MHMEVYSREGPLADVPNTHFLPWSPPPIHTQLPTEVMVSIPFPPNTQSVDCDTNESGAYNYDIKQRTIRWQVAGPNTLISQAAKLAGSKPNNRPGAPITDKIFIKGTARLTVSYRLLLVSSSVRIMRIVDIPVTKSNGTCVGFLLFC